MRRASLGGAGAGGSGFGFGATSTSIHDHLWFGPSGALTGSGDLVLETRAWRERLFAERAPQQRGSAYPAFVDRIRNAVFPGGMMGGMGGLALNQLLVTMDGIDDQTLWTWTAPAASCPETDSPGAPSARSS